MAMVTNNEQGKIGLLNHGRKEVEISNTNHLRGENSAWNQRICAHLHRNRIQICPEEKNILNY